MNCILNFSVCVYIYIYIYILENLLIIKLFKILLINNNVINLIIFLEYSCKSKIIE